MQQDMQFSVCEDSLGLLEAENCRSWCMRVAQVLPLKNPWGGACEEV
jgi:hypothetical protein